MSNRQPSGPMNRMAPEQFILRAIPRLRGKYPGLHTVYSGFNQAFRATYPKLDPVAFTQALAAKGKIGLRIVRGGAMLFLPGEVKDRSARFTEAMRGPEPPRARSRTGLTGTQTQDISDEPDDEEAFLADAHPVYAMARDYHVTTFAVLRRARSLGIQLLTPFAEVSPDDAARIRQSFRRKAVGLTRVMPRRAKRISSARLHRKKRAVDATASKKRKKPLRDRRGRGNGKPKRTLTVRMRSATTLRPRQLRVGAVVATGVRRSDGTDGEVFAAAPVVPAERTSTVGHDPQATGASQPGSAPPPAESNRQNAITTEALLMSHPEQKEPEPKIIHPPAPAESTHQNAISTEELSSLMSHLKDKERENIQLKDLVNTYEQYLRQVESEYKSERNGLIVDLTARDQELAERKETSRKLEQVAMDRRATAATFIRHLLPRIQFERDSLKTIQLLPRISEPLLQNLQLIHDGHHPEGVEKIKAMARRKCFEFHFSDGQADQGRVYYSLAESPSDKHVVLLTVGADDNEKKANIEWIRKNW